MPAFGDASIAALASCHIDLQTLFNCVIVDVDCKVTCGHRTKAAQDAAFHEERSKVRWPDSKHNGMPSLAADVIPYPVDWNDTRRFYMFVGVVRITAKRLLRAGEMKYAVRCGADWDGDFEIKDQNFHDLPHFELIVN